MRQEKKYRASIVSTFEYDEHYELAAHLQYNIPNIESVKIYRTAPSLSPPPEPTIGPAPYTPEESF